MAGLLEDALIELDQLPVLKKTLRIVVLRRNQILAQVDAQHFKPLGNGARARPVHAEDHQQFWACLGALALRGVGGLA